MTELKPYEEVLTTLDYMKHTKIENLWYTIDGKNKYGVVLSESDVPEVFRFDKLEHVEDPNDAVNKKTIAAFKQLKTAKTVAPLFVACEFCGTSMAPSLAIPVGVPVQHMVCTECSEKIAAGEIDVSGWFPEQEQVDTSIATSDVPDDPPDIPTDPDTVEPETVEPEHINDRKVSTRIVGIIPELAERGKIKIGGKGEERKAKNGNMYRLPVKSDHFTIVTTAKDDKGDFIVDTDIMDIIGNNCTELDVMVLYNDPDLIFRTSYAFFDSAKCLCRGDGHTAQLTNGDITDCDPDTCPSFKEKGCKPQGVLSVILMDSPRVGGVYKLRTTSWNTIRNITSSLDMLKSLTYGQLAGLPLVLTLKPKTVLIPGTKKQTVIFMANIEFKGTMNQLLDKAMHIAQTNSDVMGEIRRIETNARLMLDEAPSAEECKDIVEEFYPNTMMKEMEKQT